MSKVHKLKGGHNTCFTNTDSQSDDQLSTADSVTLQHNVTNSCDEFAESQEKTANVSNNQEGLEEGRPISEISGQDIQDLNKTETIDISGKTTHRNTTLINTAALQRRQSAINLFTGNKLTIITHFVSVLVMGVIRIASGTIATFSGITLTQLSATTNTTTTSTNDFLLTPGEQQLFASLPSLGVVVAGFLFSPLPVLLGQRTTILLSQLFCVGAWILLVLSPEVWVLLLAMFLLCNAVLLLNSATSTYILEVSHQDYRGNASGILITAFSFGGLFLSLLGRAGVSWRQLGMICCVLMLVPIIGVFFLPNSPRWLVTRNRITEARQSLFFFRGAHLQPEIELEEIVSQLQTHTAFSTLDQIRFLLQPHNRKMNLFSIFCSMLQGSTGAFVIQAYLTQIIQETKVPIDPYMCASLYYVADIIGMVSSLILVERLGRKPVILVALSLASICCLTISIYSYILEQNIIMIYPWLPFTALVLYGCMKGMFSPASITHLGELISTSCRAVANTLQFVSFMLTTFVLSWLYPLMVQKVSQAGVFLGFAVNCVIAALVTGLTLPETKGRSLEQIAAGNSQQAGDK